MAKMTPIDARAALRDMKVSVKIEHLREFRFRVKLAALLFKWATLVLGCTEEVDIKEIPDDIST